jgi:hypothetical protein
VRENLVVVGFGSMELKDVKNPFAELNRRVQVTNLEGGR